MTEGTEVVVTQDPNTLATPPSTDTGELVRAPADSSFESYLAACGPSLLRFARLLTGDEHRAEDLVQDTLARAYLSWTSIGRTYQPDAYVRRMLINASRSWWRRRSNREIPVQVTGDLISASRFDIESAQRDEMWRLIVSLPHRQRVVIVLRYYEDLDDAAIAEILECSPTTVRTHVMRALRSLRQRYRDGGQTLTPGGTHG